MKKILIFCSVALFLAACTQENLPAPDYLTRSSGGADIEGADEPTDRIVLGNRLANPYTVSNMQTAINLIRQQNPSLVVMFPLQIIPSHYYVKFKPRTEEELALLEQDSTLILFDHPLDYEIEEGGSYYHDPELPDSIPTYQYTAVDHFKWAAMNNAGLTVPYEVLEELYIPEQDSSLDEMIDGVGTYSLGGTSPLEEAINALVDKALEITGNSEECVSSDVTRSGSEKWTPSGTIQVYDDIVEGLIPLQNIEVRARRWFVFYRGTTDSEGNFVCDGSFRRAANYSIKWESDRFDIRDGYFFQALYNGPKQIGPWNLQITSGKSLQFSAIYRAAYRYYYGNTGGLTRPIHVRKCKITYLDTSSPTKNGDYNRIDTDGILPDIRIFGKDYYTGESRDVSLIYSTTSHELGHAAHHTNDSLKFKQATKKIRESWARCVQYHLTNLEYKSMGESLIKESRTIEIGSTGPLIFRKATVGIADYEYNFQIFNKFDSRYDSDYTPIFIDLRDHYNQQLYFQQYPSEMYNGWSYLDFVDDNIREMPISSIESAVFSSTTMEEIRGKIIDALPNTINSFSQSETEVNRLFDFY